MEAELEIRESADQDRAGIEALYPRAFPDEDLLPLVRDLVREPALTLSIVAVADSVVVGNVIFTKCVVDGWGGQGALLAPLAVAPKHQKQGIGSALVRDGLRRLEEAGIGLVFVLGDPAYYGRLGFRAETSVETPYPLPADWADAWQSLRLGDASAPDSGKLSLPGFWMDPALWSA